MADLAKSKRVRAGHKAVVTRRLSEVDNLIEAIRAGGSEAECVKLEQAKRGLQEKLATIRKLDDEIAVQTEDEEALTQSLIEADEFSQRIYEALIKIEKCFASTSASPEPIQSVGGHARTRLPELNLKGFNGELTEWFTFWDAYKSAIHESTSLSDVDKFTYLRTLLTGSALEAINGITLTAANYKEAIDILNKRFGNKQQIIARHVEALLSIDTNAGTGVPALRSLYDTVESHVRQLKTLGVSADAYNSLLPPVLMKKLPKELRLIIARNVSEENWSLDNIMEALEEELMARERTAAKRYK